MRNLVYGWAVAGALLLAAGCERSVTIEYPPKGNVTDPVKEFRVRFHKDFKPGTFRAFLNGQDISGRFNPLPTPGGLSKANSDWMEPVPNDVQILHVEGDFQTPQVGIPTKLTYDDANFSPPNIYVCRGVSYVNNVLTLKERETITATVMVLAPPKGEGLTVVVTTDENDAVSLNNAPAGAPITLTIPTNDRRVDFTIRGIRVGQSFIVKARAHGYAAKPGGGHVDPP